VKRFFIRHCLGLWPLGVGCSVSLSWPGTSLKCVFILSFTGRTGLKKLLGFKSPIHLEECIKVDQELSVPCPQSPSEVPTETIEQVVASPTKTLFKVTKSQLSYPIVTDDASDLEDEGGLIQSRSIADIAKAFERLHAQHNPSCTNTNNKTAPELPCGQSRVAALAAQLEISKIIFRPMAPPSPRKPQHDTDDQEDEDHKRHLGRPSSNMQRTQSDRRAVKGKQERPPKAPKRIYVQAQHDFCGTEEGDLSFKKGDRIELLVKSEGWCTGRLDGRSGLFPLNYTH